MRIILAGPVAHEENEHVYMILVIKSLGKGPLERPGRFCGMVLNWVVEKQNEIVWTEFSWLR
jgi:hypothetical protein